MTFLTDSALERLRIAADIPDLNGSRYRLLDRLGQGGMGSVYRAEDTLLGREVALKVVSIPDADGALSARLVREAKIIAQLEHPGIVPIHDVGTLPDGRPYYTMKLVQGERLDQQVRKSGTLSGRLRMFLKIVDAVSFAHARGVLHRDLKPSNIMIGPFGEVLVMDWGLSKVLREAVADSEMTVTNDAGDGQADGATSHGTVLGTPGYMAPEQARGENRVLDERADVFSLGAILSFLINDPGERVSRPLAAIVRKATASHPQERYSSAAELGLDLTHYLEALPVSAYPEGVAARLWRWSLRNQAWLLLILAYLVMRTLLIVFRPR